MILATSTSHRRSSEGCERSWDERREPVEDSVAIYHADVTGTISFSCNMPTVISNGMS